MIIKIFGAMDVFSAVAILFAQWDFGPWRLPLTAAAWLLMKAWLFKGDLASTIDMVVGIYAIIAIFLPIAFFSYIFAAYLFWKGTLSLFS